ncbi:MAG TPA: fused MFS/spermidine synthase [Bryobacteraceae bacterium]
MTGIATSKVTSPENGVLFGVAILLSSFLLFQVEPLIAKLILPWFGGAATVWAACMLFFQVVLLVGYGWAHWLSRQTASRQKIAYLALLGLSLVMLPILPADRWRPGPAEDPLLRILGLLAATVGLPYFLLSTTSPLLQVWRSRSEGGAMPYRLFALSNAGSLIGLLSYPVLVEPLLTNRQQVWMWSVCYCGFAAVSAVIAMRRASAEPAGRKEKPVVPPGLRERLVWMALAAAASALLLATTNHLTQNIAAMPFLWVVPLSLYLLSLILCFDRDRWYDRSLFAILAAVSMPVLAYAISGNGNIREPKAAVAVVCGTVFVLFMICHGELARRRPEPAHLTTFYLMVCAGGAAGGVLVGLAAPYLLNALYDPMIVLSLTGVLLVYLFRPDRMFGFSKRLSFIGLLIAYCVLIMAKYGSIAMLGACLLAVCVFRVSRERASVALYSMAVGLVAGVAGYLVQDTLLSIANSSVLARNFYGALAVYDQPSGGTMGPVRVLRHGVIEHGEQFLLPEYQGHATTYYARQSGIGLAIQALMTQGPLTAGVIGLGAGTLATYARPGDRYTFYEINPAVVEIAQSQFTFLSHCATPPAIIPGDARLSLEHEADRQFDILAVDAFSGDAIPAHLLTREAFRLYWRHLKADGVLAVHVSSRYLSLGPVVAAGAVENQKQAMMVAYRGDREKNESASDWVLVTSRTGFADLPEIRGAAEPIRSASRVWTDDYSNLLSVMR